MTAADLIAAAAREGLVLDPATATLDTMGLDFVVVHGVDAEGTRWIVRTPRREDVKLAARHEANVLRVVAALAPIRVPEWRIHTDDVIAYPRIDGTPAVTLDTGAPVWNVIDPAAPSEVFLRSLGETVARMQRLDVPADVKHESIAEVKDRMATTIELGIELLSPPDAVQTRWRRWLDAHWPLHTALVHGDLHPGHLLLHPDAQLAGILDWTEGRVTDPSTDFAMIHLCFGRAGLDAVIGHFERAGGRTWDGLAEHAIERAAVGPALGAEWANRTGNAAVLEQVRAQVAASS